MELTFCLTLVWLWLQKPYVSCTFVALLSFWFYRRYILPLQFFKRRGIPGPRAFPIIGSLLSDIDANLSNHQIHLMQIKKYGQVYGIFLGSRPCYMIADLNMIQHLYVKEFSKFPNRTVLFTARNFQDGIVNLRDERWKHVRTLLNPTFTASKMKQMLPIMSDSVDILLAKMEEAADTDNSINLWQWLQQLTMDIIAESAFGTKCDAQTASSDRLTKSAKAAFRINPIIMVISFMIPSLFPWLIELDRSFIGGVNYIEKVVRTIISQRRQERATEATYKDLLQLMMDSSNSSNRKGLTDDEIIAQSTTFLLAGYETTSSCIAFTAYLLATNPEVQDKLIESIQSVCGEEEVTYDMLHELEFLDMVIKESLRLYPPGFVLIRECKTDYQYNGLEFPKGISVFVPVYAIHHDPNLWPEPERFDPDRFAKEAIDARHPCAYMPFGIGSRNCVGMRFALMEIKLALVKILLRFKFVVSPETEIPLKISVAITLSPKNGVYLRIQKV